AAHGHLYEQVSMASPSPILAGLAIGLGFRLGHDVADDFLQLGRDGLPVDALAAFAQTTKEPLPARRVRQVHLVGEDRAAVQPGRQPHPAVFSGRLIIECQTVVIAHRAPLATATVRTASRRAGAAAIACSICSRVPPACTKARTSLWRVGTTTRTVGT